MRAHSLHARGCVHHDVKPGNIFCDAASGAAVAALGVAPGDSVLDLCCCPGVKLGLAAEHAGATGEVHGAGQRGGCAP